ncbi:hypothetical protein H4R18_002622 [Coemansia javaensis]|uniref:Uncharacterized protein n=1 Tax=Coemansia javaensis TaxID=2761396 RepID=A0A9W8HE57_9FUNG|nr:hypothetical protein H4R18_002622 [Coemansia javaensis]
MDAVPIEDFDYDSSGSLSTLGSAFGASSDGDLDPAGADDGPSVAPAPDAAAAAAAAPAKRKRGRPRKHAPVARAAPAAPDVAGLVTTGAFLTRTTLRKLGVADLLAGPEAPGPGLAVGGRIKVLGLDKKWHTAVALAVGAGKVLAHYAEWGHGYDEWLPVGSRRLLHRGMPDPRVSGSTAAMAQLEAEDAGGPVLAERDLGQAVQAALGMPAGASADGSGPAAPAKPRARGRPAGSRNHRRAGHVKCRRRRGQRRSADPPAEAMPAEDPPAESPPAKDPSEGCVAPEVPEELRIPAVRLARAAENPYTRRHQPEEVFGGGGAAASDCAAGEHRAAKRMRGDGGEGSDRAASDGAAVWQLGRGSYVTTGAFFTRRTVKTLAHSGSTGGIMQDLHGYYPGQQVEVMNANRAWYRGRVISYADGKFLVHFGGWGHAHNEWVAAGSKRMRTVARPDDAETEEDARKACVVLVNEYNAHIDELERTKAAHSDAQRRTRPPRKTPVNPRIAKLTGAAMAKALDSSAAADESSAVAGGGSGSDASDEEDVEPISVESGYVPVPQLLRVKDYVRLFRVGMRVAARDRNKLWWRAEVVEIKTFRLRIHYTGFSASWDEWMEMNTQRLMFVEGEDAEQEQEQGQQQQQQQQQQADAGPGTTTDSEAAAESRTAESRTAESRTAESAQPGPRRLGRSPGPETRLAPLSLRVALRALNGGGGASQAAGGEPEVFQLPKEHMSMRDYSAFLKVGDRVRVRGRDMQWSECTIIDFRHGRIRVCYSGQSDEFNQWLAVNSDRIQVLRETIESDRRVEKLEHDSQVALRRKREKQRAQRRKRSQATVASLIGLAESLEYIVDQAEGAASDEDLGEGEGEGEGEEDEDEEADDRPLLRRMLEGGDVDSMPLVMRMALAGRRGFGPLPDSATWFVYCNQCSIVIRTFRYYCTACEHPSDGYDYESYDLCLTCFAKEFPAAHPHPRAAFARAAVGDAESIVQFATGVLSRLRAQDQQSAADIFSGLVAPYEPDVFDASYDPQAPDAAGALWDRLATGLHGTTTATTTATAASRPLGRSAAVVGRIVGGARPRGRLGAGAGDNDGDDDPGARSARRAGDDAAPRCGFCGGDGSSLGGFAGGRPFVLTTPGAGGAVRRRRFWAHEACARCSPEVLATADGRWYNVAAALRRTRAIKCAGCRRRGATVGCFHDRCQKSYHVTCTRRPLGFFESGRIFWCPRHAALAAGSGGAAAAADADADAAPQRAPQCASCRRTLAGDLLWMACLECPTEPAPHFNICLACYESRDALADHPHKKRCFREHQAHVAATTTAAAADDPDAAAGHRRRRRMRRRAISCHYCHSRQSRRWRKGYGGVVMCERCFDTSQGHQMASGPVREELIDDGSEQLEVVALNPFGRSLPGALVEDYTQGTYFTRDACAAPARMGDAPASRQPLGELASYGPTDTMLFTLAVDSTYYDIPGRAPRWASHSGTDYHGTWLPQTVRRAVLRYTRRGERVLSNFLGRGTDAIECFLLSRRCVGVDINPSAISLSQRNCSFAIPPGVDMGVEFRPAIMQGDARDLRSERWPGAAYFADPECFDHILSHPPYKDCVLYSTNIDGDLSRFPGPDEFQREMARVVAESWRLLKMGRHLTLGIGDNRAECFYIPVSYQLIRNYIDCGFELDELVVKRQRYCQAFGLGTYLCVQFDFLMFTHEFIAALRKVPKDKVDPMHLPDAHCAEDVALGYHHCASRENNDSTTTTTTTTSGDAARQDIYVAARVLREVPPSPIDRKSVVMGSVWTFESHPAHPFPLLCASRMVERFGREGSNWEQIDLALRLPRDTEHGQAAATTSVNGPDSNNDSDNDSDEPEFPDNGTRAGGYERERQRQIQQNREQLLHLGLVSELGEDSTDIAHYRKMTAMAPLAEAPLALIVVPHVPNALIVRRHIEPYRRALVQITHDASARLCPSGLLVLGVQDVRDEHGKLWPLGMLVLEDVQRAIGAIRLRLKEFIVAVENGHARKRDKVSSRDAFVDERCIVGLDSPDIHIPIVHVYYLVFMRLV